MGQERVRGEDSRGTRRQRRALPKPTATGCKESCGAGECVQKWRAKWQRHARAMGGGLPRLTYSVQSAWMTAFETRCVIMCPLGARGLVFGGLDLCYR